MPNSSLFDIASRSLRRFFWLTWLLGPAAVAQTDSLRALADTSRAAADTTLAASDSTGRQEIEVKKKGELETTIFYESQDSMRFDALNSRIYIYGDGKINYDDLELTAARITIDQKETTLTASGVPDSTGRKQGIPIFKQKQTDYNADSMAYNFVTQKGVIIGAVTEQGDGYVTSKRSKRNPEGVVSLEGGGYTTCNLAVPHFRIKSKKMMTKPGKYVVSGPFNLEVNQVPTPLGFPFGFFPIPGSKQSGIITPTYGESRDRGFFLRNGGFYLNLGDYAGLTTTGQIYSLGGWGFDVNADYRKRYAFNGGASFSYNRVVREQADLSETIQEDYWLRWRHAPFSRGAGRFSANVNVGSSTYNQNNSFNTQDYISTSFNSNVSYSYNFRNSPFSLATSLRHNQNTQTEAVNLSGDANLTMARIFPFKPKESVGKKSELRRAVEGVSLSYSSRAQMQVSNQFNEQSFPFDVVEPEDGDGGESDDGPIDFNLANSSTLAKNARVGVTHNIPISTNISLLRYLTVSPSINYQEYWHPFKYDYTYSPVDEAVRVDTIGGFQRSYQYSTSLGFSTRLYSFFFFKGKKEAAIRHMMTPSVSVSYRPDFSDPNYGFYQDVQTNAEGDTRRVSRFLGQTASGPSTGESRSMSFSLGNQVEMKYKTETDSTEEFKYLQLLQNLSVSSSYNFAADSFNLANFSLSARTKLFEKVTLNMSGTLDPYRYVVTRTDDDGNPTAVRRTPDLRWGTEGALGQITNARMALNASFKAPGSNSDRNGSGRGGVGDNGDYESSFGTQEELDAINASPERYVDFNMPWNVRFSYALSYRKQGQLESDITQTLNFSGDLRMTEKWMLNFSSGYDFEEQDFSFTQLSLFRDLHCWQMSLNWIPFGLRQSYSIDISVKSSILQDLKLNKRDVWFDR